MNADTRIFLRLETTKTTYSKSVVQAITPRKIEIMIPTYSSRAVSALNNDTITKNLVIASFFNSVSMIHFRHMPSLRLHS